MKLKGVLGFFLVIGFLATGAHAETGNTASDQSNAQLGWNSEDVPAAESGQQKVIDHLAGEPSSDTPEKMEPATIYTCRAWTDCSEGHRISCYGQGNEGCRSRAVRNQSVYCEGRGLDGSVRYARAFCR